MATSTTDAVPVYSASEEFGQPGKSLPPFDEAVYETLLSHLPPTLREQVEPRMTTACDLFIGERHYEVLQTLDDVRVMCERAAATPESDGGVSVTVPTPEPLPTMSGAKPSATYMSVELFRNFLLASHMYTTATRRAADCNELLRDMEDRSGWREVRVDEKGCGTFYRLDKPSGHHYFKVVSDTPVNPIYLCGTIMELDLYTEWFPMCVHAQSQGDVSRFHKSSHFVIGAPWPFDNRDAFIEGYGIDDLEQNNRLIVVAHSLYEDAGPLPRGIRPPQKMPNTVRCDVFYGGFLIQMVSSTVTRLSFIMSIDPKVPNLPQSALNWVSGKILWQMVVEIQKASARGMDPRSKYWSRRREHTDVYELLRTRYNAALQKAASPEDFERLRLDEDY